LREFLEGKGRNLGDDVINGRLEARGGFARDVVFDFVEQVADGEFAVFNAKGVVSFSPELERSDYAG
jgi:hypothetical protein